MICTIKGEYFLKYLSLILETWNVLYEGRFEFLNSI